MPRIKKAERTGIIARPLALKDIDTIATWLADPKVAEAVLEERISAATQRRQLKKLLSLTAHDDGECGMVIEYKNSIVAFAHYMWINWVSRTAEIDICIDPTRTQKAFLTASILPCVANIAFSNLNLEKVFSFIYSDNPESLRLLTRFMKPEATLKGYLNHRAGPVDVIVAGLLKADFLAYPITKRFLKAQSQTLVRTEERSSSPLR